MLTLLAYVHIAIGLALMLFVLLQDPKGGAMGVFSGGSSANTFFGSSGASNFLTTITKWLAVLFAVSCLTLTYYSAKKGGSVMDGYVPTTAPKAPGTPEASAAAPGTVPVPATGANSTESKDLPGTHTGLDDDNAPSKNMATPPANSGVTPPASKQ